MARCRNGFAPVVVLLSLLLCNRELYAVYGTETGNGSNLYTVVVGNGSSGPIRGSGTYTGSGSMGTLPPCTECFGHGSNPDSNPKCKLGCSGSPAMMRADAKKSSSHQVCGQSGDCSSDQQDENRTDVARENERSRERKIQLIALTVAGCMFLIVAVPVANFIRRKRQERVAFSEDNSVTIENLAVVM